MNEDEQKIGLEQNGGPQLQKRFLTPILSKKVPPVPEDDERKPFPEHTSNIFSRAFFMWLIPILKVGYKRTLEPNDFFYLTDEVKVETLTDRFTYYFEREVEKQKKKYLQEKVNGDNDLGSSKSEEIKEDDEDGKYDLNIEKEFSPSKSATMLGVFYTFWWEYSLACIYMVISQVASTCGPLVSKRMIQFVELHGLGLESNVGKGVGYAIGTTVLLFISGLFLNHSFYNAMMTGLKVKAVLTKAILRKSYLLNDKSRIKYPVSKITSIMGTDLSRLEFGFIFQPFLIVMPIPIGISIAILIVYIGPASLVGVGLLIVFFMVMGMIVKSLFALRKQANTFTDLRIDTLKEVLNNLKIIKFYSWEIPYHKNISDARRSEMDIQYRMQVTLGFFASSAMSMSLFTSMASFLVLYAINGSKNPANIFSSVSLFNLLTQQLNLLPLAAATGSDAFLALTRVGVFLASKEHDQNASEIFDTSELEDMEKEGLSIKIEDANFEWAVINREDIEEANDDTKDDGNEKQDKGAPASQSQPLSEKRDDSQDSKPEVDKEIVHVRSKDTVSGDSYDESDSSAEVHFRGLKNVNLEVKKGEFIVITGQIGSGKSSLLNAISGVMQRTSGKLAVNGSELFSGVPWIQNTTVKENIIFGAAYDEQYYNRVVWACSLESDLDILPGGDKTEIGERGITLSGGQKARISLARAVYANRDIILLDDVLSAVDARVGKHIMNNCILGLLKDKTRILATHQLSLIGSADRVVFLNGDGSVNTGTVDELRSNPAFERLIKFNTESNDEDEESETEMQIDNIELEEKETIYRQISKTSKFSHGNNEESEHRDFNKGKDQNHKLMRKEEKAVNRIDTSIYLAYLREGSGIFPKYSTFFAIVILAIITTYCMLFTNTWLSFWVSKKFKDRSNGFYIGIYVMFTVLSLVFLTMELIALVYLTNRASVNLNIRAIKRILHAPMSYMDTTPMGRILNRFTKDTSMVDFELGQELRVLILTFSQIVGTIILCIIYIPYFAIAIPFLIFLITIIGTYYQASAREIIRIEALQRSFIYDNFNESLNGMSTIKAYQNENLFFDKLDRFINRTNEASYLTSANQRWLGINLSIVSSCFVLLLGLLCVNKVFNINAASTGLLLSYALELVQMLVMFIRTFTEVENIMNSVERLSHYAYDLPQENSYDTGEITPAEFWPEKGAIRFQDVSMAYRPGLPLVLKNLNIDIKPGEKIGICGRTGAGKSTIMNAIFRLTELESGILTIDDVDISKLGLHPLRSKLSIIPQESVLFRGTIRKNLDPFGNYSDDQLWSALKKAGLIEEAKLDLVKKQTLDDGDMHKFHLDHVVIEDGGNYSLGERQLIAFARAVVRDSKILILDEATSSVDYDTDEKIQKNIVKQFSHCTILCIAHRLKTILSYDRIIVMDKGELKEVDTPWNLFNLKNSIFQQMCRKSGIEASDFSKEAP